MPTVDFQPIANGASANVISQAQFITALAPGGSLQNGFQSGIAASNQFNKVMRQSSMVSSALATLIANTLGINVVDDGVLATLVANLTSTIQQTAASGAWSTGDAKLTLKSVADPTWVLANDGTIGDASSGGTTRANADTQALFFLLWTNVSNTWAAVSGGRGASAAADFAAHKTIALTKVLGRALAIGGAGSGLTARALGQNVGEETHLLLAAESGVGAHAHTFSSGNTSAGSGATNGQTGQNNSGVTSNVSANASQAHNIMQPTSFWNLMLKL